MQITKNNFLKTIIASSVLLAAGLVNADTGIVDVSAQLAGTALNTVNIKQDLNQTVLQLKQQLEQDIYHNARRAIAETEVPVSDTPLLQH